MKTDAERRLLIMARFHRDFVDFCRDNDLNPHDRKSVIYIKDPDALRGYREEWLLILSPLADHVVHELVTIGQHILLKESETGFRMPSAPRIPLPEIKAIRGGIRFPKPPERQELEGRFL